MTDRHTHVLLIEEDCVSASAVCDAVHAAGRYRVAVEERLATGLARLARERFDAVLLDPGLPDASGIAAVEALRAAAPELPLVVLTGSADAALEARAVALGAQDFLQKGTVDGLLVSKSLAHAIDRHALVRALEAARLRAAEQSALLTSVLDGMTEGVIAVERDGLIAVLNRAARAVYGPPPPSGNLFDWRLGDLFFRADGVVPIPLDDLPLRRALRGESVDGVEMAARTPARPGGIILTSSGRPLRDATGAVTGAVVVFRDDTARKASENRTIGLVAALEQALAQVRTLHGFVQICSACKRIHDGGHWSAVEKYVAAHSEATFTHSFCPECLDRLYPEPEDDEPATRG